VSSRLRRRAAVQTHCRQAVKSTLSDFITKCIYTLGPVVKRRAIARIGSDAHKKGRVR
jgi:hypothetical protein